MYFVCLDPSSFPFLRHFSFFFAWLFEVFFTARESESEKISQSFSLSSVVRLLPFKSVFRFSTFSFRMLYVHDVFSDHSAARCSNKDLREIILGISFFFVINCENPLCISFSYFLIRVERKIGYYL